MAEGGNKTHLGGDIDNDDKENGKVEQGISVVVVQGWGNYASVVHGQDSNGYHGVEVLGWMEGDGGVVVGSACHKGSTRDRLVYEKSSLHPTMDHVCGGYMYYSHELVCPHQLKGSCEPLVPCGLYQKLFGFLDHGRDSRNLSQVWILPL